MKIKNFAEVMAIEAKNAPLFLQEGPQKFSVTGTGTWGKNSTPCLVTTVGKVGYKQFYDSLVEKPAIEEGMLEIDEAATWVTTVSDRKLKDTKRLKPKKKVVEEDDDE